LTTCIGVCKVCGFEAAINGGYECRRRIRLHVEEKHPEELKEMEETNKRLDAEIWKLSSQKIRLWEVKTVQKTRFGKRMDDNDDG